MGVVDPDNSETQHVIGRLEQAGFSVTSTLISLPSFVRSLQEYDHIPQKREEIGDTVTIQNTSTLLATLPLLKAAVPSLAAESTSALFEALLDAGLETGASDIHIEPTDTGAHLRLRVDGILEDVGIVSSDVYDRLLSRIKVIAHIPLNVVTMAHDGRFTITKNAKEAEVRVSILPSPGGEYVVLRLLNPDAVALKVEELGLEENLWTRLKPELARPNGIILTTGPTGSGKTTTLYAFLSYLTSPEVKIITLENPIEYHVEGISQTQIEDTKGYGFADGLRAALRHDPDIILVGEIRDSETAEAALNAALTGHLVFSTLHTNDAAGAIPRFLDLNAKAAILSSALRVVIAQRLVRRLCEKCKHPLTGPAYKEVRDKIVNAFNARPLLGYSIEGEPALFTAVGCAVCSGSGYRGRAGVFELIITDPEFEKLVSSSPTHQEVASYAEAKGFESMYINGLRKVVAGITSFEEVERVAASG